MSKKSNIPSQMYKAPDQMARSVCRPPNSILFPPYSGTSIFLIPLHGCDVKIPINWHGGLWIEFYSLHMISCLGSLEKEQLEKKSRTILNISSLGEKEDVSWRHNNNSSESLEKEQLNKNFCQPGQFSTFLKRKKLEEYFPGTMQNWF